MEMRFEHFMFYFVFTLKLFHVAFWCYKVFSDKVPVLIRYISWSTYPRTEKRVRDGIECIVESCPWVSLRLCCY